MMNDPGVPFIKIVEYTKPYLVARSLSGVLMTLGHVAFAILLFRIMRRSSVHLKGPTLFTTRRSETLQEVAHA
jgi:cytochrome c oxidase cbb3-type subunit 1